MSTLTAIATMEAVELGRAVPTTTVRHTHLGENPFVLIPLSLAGEACAPLAALCGTDRDNPTLLVVPQPRNRDQRFAFAASLAELILGYFESCRLQSETYYVGQRKEERERYVDAPQVLVPNGGGISFLRLLGRSTRLRRTDGPNAVLPVVPLLGKWLTWLGDQAEYSRCSMLMPMTGLLAAHWATGQSSSEDANLGALSAWIDPPHDMSGDEAALRAEDPSVCPPAGPSTDPIFDQQELEPAINAYAAAASATARGGALRLVTEALRGQLMPTWELMWHGVDLLRALPPGASVPVRWAQDRAAFTAYSEYLEGDAWPQPRRDNAARAAQRLAFLEEAENLYQVQRAYDDPLIMAEHELTGGAFVGEVMAQEEARMVPSPTSNRMVFRPLVTVRADRMPFEVGTELRSPSRLGQKARVLDIRLVDGGFEADLELEGGLNNTRRPPAPPGTIPALGEEVCYTTLAAFGSFGSLPGADETPWTHGGPPPTYYEPTDEDAEEEWQ